MKRERGILFSSAMVKAIMEGRKTITRRLVDMDKLAVKLPHTVTSDMPELITPVITAKAGRHPAHLNPHGAVFLPDLLGVKPGEFNFVCPYADGYTRIADFPSRHGKWRSAWEIVVDADQYLWVRETWRRDGLQEYVFRADRDDPGKAWKPGIHLPRVAARIVLSVRSVRLERLHDITEEEARLEGVKPFFEQFPGIGKDQRITTGELAVDQPYRASFACLWDEINGERALWKTNPWVWAISFNVHSIAKPPRKQARLDGAAQDPKPLVKSITLDVAERLIREAERPLSVREIVEMAGTDLTTRSATPENTVARDLAMHIKKYGDRARFVRPSPGRFALRDLEGEA